jgi:predicted  nucleic acid-binding Zn-ribbon protein
LKPMGSGTGRCSAKYGAGSLDKFINRLISNLPIMSVELKIEDLEKEIQALIDKIDSIEETLEEMGERLDDIEEKLEEQ